MTDDRHQGEALPLRLVALGAALILGGEAFCILGPLRYEATVHFACHIALYSGIALTVIGAAIHLWPRSR